MIETVPLANAAEPYGRMMRNEARFRIVMVAGQQPPAQFFLPCDTNSRFDVGLVYTVAIAMQAKYVMKVQVIRSKRRPPRFFVNVPLPLAAALDLTAGEQVQWQLLDRSDLRLKRLAAPAASRRTKK